MNILMITQNDPAGMAIAFTNAINRYTEHTCRLITSQERYGIYFGKDIHLPDIHDDDFGEVEQLLKNADIFHFHMLQNENSCLGPLVIRNFIKGKKILHHHHGHPDFLINAPFFNEKYKKLRRKVIVSTPDLLKVANNSTWVPNLVPINDVHYQPRFDNTLPQHPVKICQAPTRKYDKHTDVFKQAISKLKAHKPHIEEVIIERRPHLECLSIKRKCHIVFDHMRGWFGISSLESLAHGKPVIAGLDEWNVRCIKEFTGVDDLPWVLARSPQELSSRIISLVDDPDLRKQQGIAGRRFMENCWNERIVLECLFNQYGQL
ncbi:MAG: hypothetical protein B1H11_07020 [Desulfobacteraceae bacterium 4484_190.1]|nr:MAG: hypothetical protein B1H11_07020 [Desulfobacteraceae bacterium 4484_190.1]